MRFRHKHNCCRKFSQSLPKQVYPNWIFCPNTVFATEPLWSTFITRGEKLWSAFIALRKNRSFSLCISFGTQHEIQCIALRIYSAIAFTSISPRPRYMSGQLAKSQELVSSMVCIVCPVLGHMIEPNDTPSYERPLVPSPASSVQGCGNPVGRASTIWHTAFLMSDWKCRHLNGCFGFIDVVGWASSTKYKYYLFQATTSFCNTTSKFAREYSSYIQLHPTLCPD